MACFSEHSYQGYEGNDKKKGWRNKLDLHAHLLKYGCCMYSISLRTTTTKKAVHECCLFNLIPLPFAFLKFYHLIY